LNSVNPGLPDVITRDELTIYMKDKTVKYLIPDMVVMLDDFPRTASGKVQKFKLREIAITKLKNDRA